MRKATAYGQRKAEEDRNITEKSHAIRNKMQEKAARVDEYTTSSGKVLAMAGLVLSGLVVGAVLAHAGTLWVVVVGLLVLALGVGGAAFFFFKARALINTPVAVRPDGSPLIM